MGCTKLTYQKNHFLEIVHSKKRVRKEIKRVNYYPFGLKHKGYNNLSTSSNIALKHKFGGMEYNEELGLEWYDISARNYDPALGRWMNLDPLAETMRRHSPYNYAFDNPIYFMDPDGMSPIGTLASGGSINALDVQNSAFGGNQISSASITVSGTGTGSSAGGSVASTNAGSSNSSNNDDSNNRNNSSGDLPNVQVAEATESGPPNKFKEYFEQATLDPVVENKGKCLLCIAGRNTESRLDEVLGFMSSQGKLASVLALNLSRFKDIGSIETATQLRWIGRFAAAGAVGIDYLRYRSGSISGSEFSMNTTWTGIGVFGGGGGLAVSALYYFAGEILGGREMAQMNFERIQRMKVENPEAYSQWKKNAKCFVAGTKVLMSDSSEKKIEDIVEGDKILSVNTSNFKFEEDRVIQITKFESKKIIKMILSDGKEFKFTEDHPFWVVGKGWSVYNINEAKNKLTFQVNEIKNRDYILIYDEGKLIPVQIIELFDTKKLEDVYNLDNVEINNTFFANKALVHNRAN